MTPPENMAAAPTQPNLTEEPEYWASSDDGEMLAGFCRERVDGYQESMKSSSFWRNARRNWRYFHNMYGGKSAGNKSIESLGRDGQLKQISLNHFRELIGHVVDLVTQNRPDFQTEATRDDHDSLKNAELGDAVVNDYLVEGRLEKRFRRAVEHALVMQMGFIFCPWDWHTGPIIGMDSNETTGQPVPLRGGDFRFYNPPVFDVIWDFGHSDWETIPWVMVRTWENKYDIAARIMDENRREDVLALKNMDADREESSSAGTVDLMFFDVDEDKSDLIPVWHFMHKDTDACPGGRMFSFTSNDIPLSEVSELPYQKLPIFRIVPDEVLLTSFGYSMANDLQAPQEALNSEVSTILTNHSAAGIQAIWVPTGCELDEHMVGNGVLIVEGGQIPPQGVNFAKTPREFFQFKQELGQSMEMISGVNSVARGQPEASLRTGEALKVLDSKAVQATNKLLSSYYESIEDVGTFILQHLPLFMKGQDQRVVRMVGQNNIAYMKTFQREGLQDIARVKVQAGNALSKTVSGRLAIADKLLEHGFVRTQQEYLTVLNTGQLDPMVRSDQAELDLIKDENQRLQQGIPAYADATDYHCLLYTSDAADE